MCTLIGGGALARELLKLWLVKPVQYAFEKYPKVLLLACSLMIGRWSSMILRHDSVVSQLCFLQHCYHNVGQVLLLQDFSKFAFHSVAIQLYDQVVDEAAGNDTDGN